MTKKQRQATVYLLIFLAGMAAGALAFFVVQVQSSLPTDVVVSKKSEEPVKRVQRPEIREMLLTPNEFSRPQLELKEVNAVVIHYVANPGTSAKDNRNYFEGLKDSGATYASSNFIVGLEGEIIQCVPLDEVAYCSNNRNEDSISIECCHPDESGKFNDNTYQSLVHLTAWLCGRYNLTADKIIRHYDITGKNCPKYYVENEGAWTQFRLDVEAYISKYGEDVAQTEEEPNEM
ncbi:MAG: peptidoglycan recognition family protein [Lachnospiraceae bacterium]|nr:peptidoglycan recognition family protein [Lachnospiraceae bacterium]